MNTKDLNSYDVENILEEHNNFFNTQVTKNIEFRIKALRRLKNTIKRYEDEIFEALLPLLSNIYILLKISPPKF